MFRFLYALNVSLFFETTCLRARRDVLLTCSRSNTNVPFFLRNISRTMAATVKPINSVIPILTQAISIAHIPSDLLVGLYVSIEEFSRVVKIDQSALEGLPTGAATSGVADHLVNFVLMDLYQSKGGTRHTRKMRSAAARVLRTKINQVLEELAAR